MRHPFLSISPSVLALTLLSGCSWLGDVSSNMRVDTGLEPQNIDSNVRFRTTYYFRVLTGCSIDTMAPADRADDKSPFAKRVKGEFVPLNDSLYRFRMTGQAAALFNRVHFESGVLRKEQIDPFGSSVRYNEQTHAFTPISADDVRADNARHAAMQDVEQFRKIYTDLVKDDSLTVNHKTQLYTKLITMIEDRLDQIKASRPQGAISPPSSPGIAGTDPTDIELINLEKELSATESKLGEATTQFVSTQSTLDEAKKKVADIIANLTSAKAALTSPDPSTGKSKQDIETLTTELTEAEQALIKAETNRNAAQTLVTGLTKESRDVKTAIVKSRQGLTGVKKDTVTSLKTLKEKVEELLKELGEKIPASEGAPENWTVW